MRIAINCLGVNGGGGKTYLEHFLPALCETDPQSEYFVLVRSGAMHTLPQCGASIRYVPVSLYASALSRMVLEQAWLPLWLKREHIDLLYSPADSTSLLAPCPVVLAMRNMNLYVKRDQGWSVAYKTKFSILSAFARISSKIARRIIFVSHASRQIIAQQLNILPEKQKVVYHGVSPAFLQRVEKIPETVAWITQKTPYILSVSSIYRYKNFIRLIEAFADYRKSGSRDYHLVIAGYPHDKPYYQTMKRAIAKANLESRVYLAHEVNYAHLPALYQNADLFAFPSYLETFGHPLVEALASAVPVIAGDIENSREIAGKAALYFNPYDKNDLRHVLAKALEDKKIRDVLLNQAKEQVKKFSWARCASQTYAVFKRALN